MRRFLRRYGDIAFAVLCAAYFSIWPEIDLLLVEPFYVPGTGFPAEGIWWVRLIYEVVARLWILAFVFIILLLAGILPRWGLPWVRRRKALAYLLVVLLIGPGLIVNSALKDHWGRPRPVHLAKFGGTMSFVPIFEPSNQCKRNCAFPSGHAAAAFFPMAGFWLSRRRRWLVGGIAFGLVVGYVRMAMGAHFLSDIIFSGLIVHFTCRGFAYLFGFRVRLPMTYPESAIPLRE